MERYKQEIIAMLDRASENDLKLIGYFITVLLKEEVKW